MFLNVIFDLVLILILVLGSYYGYSRGLFRMLARPVRLLFCFVFAFSLCRITGEMFIVPIINTPITNYIRDFIHHQCLGLDPNQVLNNIPTLIKISAAVFDIEIDTAAEKVSDLTERIVFSLSAPTVKIISIAIAFIALFVMARLISKLLIELVDSVVNLGLVGSLNRSLGVVFSCVFAFALAWLFATGTDFLLHSSLFYNVTYIKAFDGGPIYRFFISFSIVRLLFSF